MLVLVSCQESEQPAGRALPGWTGASGAVRSGWDGQWLRSPPAPSGCGCGCVSLPPSPQLRPHWTRRGSFPLSFSHHLNTFLLSIPKKKEVQGFKAHKQFLRI